MSTFILHFIRNEGPTLENVWCCSAALSYISVLFSTACAMYCLLISNFCGAFGLVLSMQYFSSLVIAVAGLLQPVVAEFLAFGIGVGLLPGLLGWIGNIMVAGGTLAVVYPSEDPGKDGDKPTVGNAKFNAEEEIKNIDV